MRATQLQLFEAHSALLAATLSYAKAVSAYEADISKNPVTRAEVKEATEDIKAGRKLVNRLARTVANVRYTGATDPYRAAWSEAYTELLRRTGYHPATELMAPNDTHLDAVCRKGLLDELADVFRSMVTLPVT